MSWVKLRTLTGESALVDPDSMASQLQRPLLITVEEEDSGLHIEYAKSPSAEREAVVSPDGSIDLPVLSPASTSPPSSINGDQPKRKKKLVWASEVDEEASSPTYSSPDALLPGEAHSRPQSYILFEGREGGEGEGYIHVKRERTRSSFLSGASIVSEGDITENQFDYKTDFIKVEVPSSNPDGSSITTAQELLICKRTALKPFLTFLKLIGWRAFFVTRQDIDPSWYIRLLNVMYPVVLFSLLVLSCATQIVTCFYRDQPVQPTTSSRNGSILIDCREDLFTRLIFPDILLLFAYLWGLYIFRYGAPEHLITLVETVFLSSQGIRKGQTRMVNFMRLIMVCGILWVVLDFCISIARVFSLQLLEERSFLHFLTNLDPNNMTLKQHTTTEQALRFTFVVFDFFGFIFFDLLYIAVIVTYSAQCQLVRLYIGTIIDKVLLKLQGYTLEQAMTDISKTYEFLQVLNGKLSALVSVCLLVFVEAAVSSLAAVFQLKVPNNGVTAHVVVGAVVGVGNILLWCVIAIVPILQAARLTSRCQQLRRLGLSVGHRPYTYHNTPQLLLDSFVQYTSFTRYRAKLAGIPIYPSFVIGGLFLFVLVGSFLVIFIPVTRVARWF